MKDPITLEKVIATGKEVEDDFWSDYTPVSDEDLGRIESSLNISLPEDFKDFYRRVGWGDSPGGIRIASPDYIISECSVPIYHVSGSYFSGDRWANLEEHKALWISRGAVNPNPERFTNEAMDLEGVKLWDLLAVGSDGCCGAFHIYTGDESPVYHFCMIHSSNLEYTSDSFLEGFLRVLHDELESIAECALDD